MLGQEINQQINHCFKHLPAGGAVGKSFPRTNFILNIPPSYGVPAVQKSYSTLQILKNT